MKETFTCYTCKKTLPVEKMCGVMKNELTRKGYCSDCVRETATRHREKRKKKKLSEHDGW